MADLSRAITLDPGYVWAISCRGLTYQLMERYADALADFDRALELDPGSAWALGIRGETYRLMDRREKALADFADALEADPGYHWVLSSRGALHRDAARFREALVDFDRAIELEPDGLPSVEKRAETYRAMGRFDEALTTFGDVLRREPENAWVRYQVGLMRWQQGEKTLADNEFAEAVELERVVLPRAAGREFTVAVHLSARGLPEPALTQLRAALAAPHDAEDVQAALDDFAELHRTTGHDVSRPVSLLRTAMADYRQR